MTDYYEPTDIKDSSGRASSRQLKRIQAMAKYVDRHWVELPGLFLKRAYRHHRHTPNRTNLSAIWQVGDKHIVLKEWNTFTGNRDISDDVQKRVPITCSMASYIESAMGQEAYGQAMTEVIHKHMEEQIQEFM